MLHRLDAEGKALETILRTADGENSGTGMRRWDDLILISKSIIGGGHSEWFVGFYHPLTGATFHAYKQED